LEDLQKEREEIWEDLWIYKIRNMKNIYFFIVLIFLSFQLTAQDNATPALFPGGDSAWNVYITSAFIKQNMVNQMTKKEIERFGKTQKAVYTFAVLADGTIGLINIEGQVSQPVRSEINRVLKNSPVWTPATLNGKPTIYRKKQISTFTFD
jgi:hypothetical protein